MAYFVISKPNLAQANVLKSFQS